MWSFLVDNQIFLLALGLITGIVIVIVVNKLSKSTIDIDLKSGKVKAHKNDGKVIIEKPDQRDNTQYKLYMIKALDCQKEINKLKLDLINRQFEVFNTHFVFIYNIIVDEFREGYHRWCEEKTIKPAKDFENSLEFIKYQNIIKEITEDNITSVHLYVKDNDLWRYTDNEWIDYKKRNSKKYREKAKEKFKAMYNSNICKVPVAYHNMKILRVGDKKIRETISNMQDELRYNSIKIHNRIEQIEKRKNAFMQFREA